MLPTYIECLLYIQQKYLDRWEGGGGQQRFFSVIIAFVPNNGTESLCLKYNKILWKGYKIKPIYYLFYIFFFIYKLEEVHSVINWSQR